MLVSYLQQFYRISKKICAKAQKLGAKFRFFYTALHRLIHICKLFPVVHQDDIVYYVVIPSIGKFPGQQFSYCCCLKKTKYSFRLYITGLTGHFKGLQGLSKSIRPLLRSTSSKSESSIQIWPWIVLHMVGKCPKQCKAGIFLAASLQKLEYSCSYCS